MTSQVGCPCCDKLIGKFGNHHQYHRDVGEKALRKIDIGDGYVKMPEKENKQEESCQTYSIYADSLAHREVE